jgi:hypothetical protein
MPTVMDDEDRTQPWWTAPAAMLILMEYLSEESAYNKEDMLYAMEKPWKYAPEYERAVERREEVRHGATG